MLRHAALCLALVGCASTARPAPATPARAEPQTVVPLDNPAQHFHSLAVRVDGAPTVAILDTGIGLALISRALCDRIGCEVNGAFSGRRMSGQEVRVPLTRLERLEVGSVARENVIAGVIDIEGFFPAPEIEAFVGLPFFEDRPFTIDTAARTLTIESDETLAARERAGHAVAIRLDRQGPALDIFVRVRLGSGGVEAEVLVDTGSPGVTLHPRYADALGIDLASDAVQRREGRDETGHTYERFFTTLEGPLAFADAPALDRRGLRAMFQEIIHDGLIGVELLSSFVVTYDLPRQRLIVTERASTP